MNPKQTVQFVKAIHWWIDQRIADGWTDDQIVAEVRRIAPLLR